MVSSCHNVISLIPFIRKCFPSISNLKFKPSSGRREVDININGWLGLINIECLHQIVSFFSFYWFVIECVIKLCFTRMLCDVEFVEGYEILSLFRPELTNKQTKYVLMAPSVQGHHKKIEKVMVKDNIECAFPNLEISLQILLTLMVTDCSAERSFSHLKHMNNPNRTTMKNKK